MSEQRPSPQEQAQAEAELSARREGIRQAANTAEHKQRERLQNPDFVDRVAGYEEAGNLHDWTEDELGPALNQDQALGFQEEGYAEEQRLLKANAAERMLTERRPGELLRRNPVMHAHAQGLHGDALKTPKCDDAMDPTSHAEYIPPLQDQPDHDRVVREAYEIAANKASLSEEGYLVESVTTATSEQRLVEAEESESQSIADRASKVFR
jgi:hypothetical protein